MGASGGQLTLQYHIGGEGSDYAVVGGEYVFGERFAAQEILVSIPAGLSTTLGGDFPLLGGIAGNSVWVLPNTDPYPVTAPFLGFSTEGFDTSPWDAFRFTLGNVQSPTGNGGFAVWTGLSLGGINPLLSTVEGTSRDYFDLSGSGHVHYFLGFTEPGLWEIDFTVASTYLPDGTLRSVTETFHFQVVPEPSPALLPGAGAISLAWRRRRSGSSR